MAEDRKIPKGRVRRSAKLGTTLGVQGARYAGTKAASVARSEEGRKEKLENRHLEAAIKLMGTLGEMKGAAMKLGQMASFIDIEFLPPEYREIYQEQLAKLRTDAPAMPWEKVVKVLEEEYEGVPLRELFTDIEREAFAAASIGQVHRAELPNGAHVAVKIQYPGSRRGARGRPAKRGDDRAARRRRSRRGSTRSRSPPSCASGCWRSSTTSTRRRTSAASRAPTATTRSSTCPTSTRGSPAAACWSPSWSRGRTSSRSRSSSTSSAAASARSSFASRFGSIYHLQHFNADAHPGNYILMEDGRVAFLDFGMTKRLDREQIVLEQRAVDAAVRKDPESLREALHELGFVKNPSKLDAERLIDHVMVVGGWYIEDREYEVSSQRVMKVIESTSDPRSEYFDLVRRESVPADELMGRRMETGVLAVLAQLRAKRNWHRIMREWVYGDPPETELGEQEWAYFESRGVERVPGLPG